MATQKKSDDRVADLERLLQKTIASKATLKDHIFTLEQRLAAYRVGASTQPESPETIYNDRQQAGDTGRIGSDARQAELLMLELARLKASKAYRISRLIVQAIELPGWRILLLPIQIFRVLIAGRVNSSKHDQQT